MRKGHGNPNDGENTPPHPPFNGGAVRNTAHEEQNTNMGHAAKHDAALAHLDKSEGSESGGR